MYFSQKTFILSALFTLSSISLWFWMIAASYCDGFSKKEIMALAKACGLSTCTKSPFCFGLMKALFPGKSVTIGKQPEAMASNREDDTPSVVGTEM